MPTPFIVLMVVVAGLDLLILALPWILRQRGVNLWWHTMFGPALVFDSTDNEGVAIRLLNVRGKYQSVAYVDRALRWELACVYHRYFSQIVDIAGFAGQAAAVDDKSAQAVVIGGGGYSFPKWLVAHCPSLTTTVVEIDAKITEIAREYFFLDELAKEFNCTDDGRLSLVCADGWQWLRSSNQAFDLIVNDAFSGKHPLGPLGTTEGAQLIHQKLTESGVYLANVIAPLKGRGSEHLQEVIQAFTSEFTYVWLIPEADDEPELTGDNVLVASDQPLDIAKRYRV